MSLSTPKSRREKGSALEEYVASRIRELGLDSNAKPSRGSGSGNREKGDIETSLMVLGQNAGIECKHYDVLAIQPWWKQTQKLERLSREPVLAFKQTADSFDGTRVVIYLETFLELLKRAGGGPALVDRERPESREKKYAFAQLKIALSRAIKYMDED